ncbi:MAG TPA: nucleotidyltransferase domain-containing protein, partial [Thermosynergistes sp.]|nr:nucleotidyltransferase domain-containing protein [Thermosynergistes sp.]
DSDIDIGLVIKPLSGEPETYYFKMALAVENRLGRLDGHPFDVIPLNTVNSIFAFKVIKSGHLIYDRDHETITDFIEIISRRYGENYPRYIESLRDIVGA